MTYSALVYLVNNESQRPDRTEEWALAKPHRGDVVAVADVDRVWGKRESKQSWIAAGEPAETFPGTFAVVRVVDGSTTGDDVRPMLESNVTRLAVDGDAGYVEGEDREVLVYRHAWRLRLSELSGLQTAELQTTGEVELTEVEFNAAGEHKADRTFFDPGAPDGKGDRRPDADDPLPPEFRQGGGQG